MGACPTTLPKACWKAKTKAESNGEELYRRCRGCKTLERLSEFSRDETKSFGRQSICRECEREADKRYYIHHSDEKKEYPRKYRTLHPKRVKNRKRRYNQTSQGRLNHNLATQRRRARKADARGDGIATEQIEGILERQKNRCNMCGKKNCCITSIHDRSYRPISCGRRSRS